jgi:hypothetical protein
MSVKETFYKIILILLLVVLIQDLFFEFDRIEALKMLTLIAVVLIFVRVGK